MPSLFETRSITSALDTDVIDALMESTGSDVCDLGSEHLTDILVRRSRPFKPVPLLPIFLIFGFDFPEPSLNFT